MTSRARRSLEIAARAAEEQRRLAHPGLATDKDEAGGDEAAAEDAIELCHAGRDASSLLDLDVDETEEGARLRAAAVLWGGRRLLD